MREMLFIGKNRKRIKRYIGGNNMAECIQLGEQLIAGFIDGIQLTDPAFAIRIRTLVEEKINERQSGIDGGVK
jgi:hypothetical protein